MLMKNLYNEDGTLSTEAQFLLTSPKPNDIAMKEWKTMLKNFKLQLSQEDKREFIKLRNRAVREPFFKKNKEETRSYQKAYRQKNKEERRAYQKVYYQKNKEERRRVYCQKNKEKRKAWDKKEKRAYMAEYARTRRQKDPLYKFFHSIRSQAVRVVKQVGLGKKPTNTFKWVGCSPEQLKAHIESLFLEGMSWDNYGKHGWHVDHIRPVSSFKPEEWERINHYTNLQPLWAKDNLSKGDKVNQRFIS